LKLCPDSGVATLGDDPQLVSAVSKILNAAAAEMSRIPEERKVSLEARVKSGNYRATPAPQNPSPARPKQKGTGARLAESAEFTVRQLSHSVGMKGVTAVSSPGRAVSLVGLKSAEKIVTAAGFARPGDCRIAVAGLALSSVSTTAGCMISLGLGCGIAVFVFAYDAFVTYDKCMAP
jgi:hypothetical protein